MIKTSSDGQQPSRAIVEFSLEGVLEVNPEGARDLMDLILNSPLAGFVTMRIPGQDWVKLDSRWGTSARHQVYDSRTSLACFITQRAVGDRTTNQPKKEEK